MISPKRLDEESPCELVFHCVQVDCVAAAAEGGGAAGAELWTQAGASGVQVEPIKLKNASNPVFQIRIHVDPH